jgi:hypothetical protein
VTPSVDVGDPVQVQRQPAPAAADIEHALPRLEQQFRGDVGLLVELGLLDAVAEIGEVAAAVLHVGIEEGAIELVAHVVMVDHVGTRAGLVIERVEVVLEAAGIRLPGAPPAAVFPPAVAADHGHQVEHVALFELQPVVHPCLDRVDGRIAHDLHRSAVIRQPHGDRVEVGIGRAVAVLPAPRSDDRQLAPFEELAEHSVE